MTLRGCVRHFDVQHKMIFPQPGQPPLTHALLFPLSDKLQLFPVVAGRSLFKHAEHQTRLFLASVVSYKDRTEKKCLIYNYSSILIK